MQSHQDEEENEQNAGSHLCSYTMFLLPKKFSGQIAGSHLKLTGAIEGLLTRINPCHWRASLILPSGAWPPRDGSGREPKAERKARRIGFQPILPNSNRLSEPASTNSPAQSAGTTRAAPRGATSRTASSARTSPARAASGLSSDIRHAGPLQNGVIPAQAWISGAPSPGARPHGHDGGAAAKLSPAAPSGAATGPWRPPRDDGRNSDADLLCSICRK